MLLFHIAIPLMAMIIGIGMFFYASSNADLTQFWKDFYAKDIALTLDSVYGVNGDVDLFYKIRNPDHVFQYEITEGKVSVSRLDPRDHKSVFQYARRETVKLDSTDPVILFDTFPIIRKENKVFFEEQERSVCDFVYTQAEDYKNKKLYVGTFNSDPNDKTLDFIEIIKQNLRANGYNLEDSEDMGNLWIYISYKDVDFTEIYYQSLSNPESRKLACILGLKLNAVTTAFYPYGVYEVLEKRPAMIIEIGNVKTAFYPQKIEQSIKEYYE